MQWLIRTVVAVAVLFGGLLGIGWLLPSEFKVQRSLQVAATPDRVYALIADPREWRRWTVWNQRDPAMKLDYSGPPSGSGARASWQSETEGSGAMQFVDAEPGRRIVYKLSFPDFGMESLGVLNIVPAGNGVTVTWTNEGDLGDDPVKRWFGLVMDRMVGPDFEAGLVNLKQLAESG